MTTVKELRDNLNQLVNRHYETPEMLRFYSFPMTVARAKVMLVHQLHFNMNREEELEKTRLMIAGDDMGSIDKLLAGENDISMDAHPAMIIEENAKGKTEQARA
jgi:hypothetical protein